MIMKRFAQVIWSGDLVKGKGILNSQSKILNNSPIGVPASKPELDVTTNPEELLGAAQAGCYAMTLSALLAKKKLVATSIDAKAYVTMTDTHGYNIEEINIICKAKIPGASDELFKEAAELAKLNCPVSKIVKCKITLDATLEH